MVKIMENPFQNGMIWGENPPFKETHIIGDDPKYTPKIDLEPVPKAQGENGFLRLGFGVEAVAEAIKGGVGLGR